MTAISETRNKFNLLIGQLIEQTIGVSGVRELFEAAENGDKEALERIEKAKATGKAPSGFLALDLGFVNVETKEALLTAQAAERTLLALEELEKFSTTHLPAIQEIIADKTVADHSDFNTNFYSPHKPAVDAYMLGQAAVSEAANTANRAFSFIGLKGESHMLVLAQATHQLATEYYRNERVGHVQEILQNPLKIGQMKPLGQGYLDGFKAQAAQSYQAAAEVLHAKGHETLAQDMQDVVGSIAYDPQQAARHSPKDFAETAQWLQHRLAAKETNMYYTDTPREVSVNADWNKNMTIYARRALGLTA